MKNVIKLTHSFDLCEENFFSVSRPAYASEHRHLYTMLKLGRTPHVRADCSEEKCSV